jgi:triacylglycerol lipase
VSDGCALAAVVPAYAANPVEAPRWVILVHGIWDNAWTLRKLDATLCKAGFQTVKVTLTPNDGKMSLDGLASQMREQIDREIPRHERFSIVAFSMGGLVARSYLRQFGEPRRLASFVSISSPHAGTWTAWLINNPGARDMRPGSAFLASIAADAARYEDTRWVTIRTPLDLVIVPSTSSKLSWAKNDSFIVALHPLMLWDRRVLRRVLEELTLSAAVSPHRSDRREGK